MKFFIARPFAKRPNGSIQRGRPVILEVIKASVGRPPLQLILGGAGRRFASTAGRLSEPCAANHSYSPSPMDSCRVPGLGTVVHTEGTDRGLYSDKYDKCEPEGRDCKHSVDHVYQQRPSGAVVQYLFSNMIPDRVRSIGFLRALVSRCRLTTW